MNPFDVVGTTIFQKSISRCRYTYAPSLTARYLLRSLRDKYFGRNAQNTLSFYAIQDGGSRCLLMRTMRDVCAYTHICNILAFNVYECINLIHSEKTFNFVRWKKRLELLFMRTRSHLVIVTWDPLSVRANKIVAL
jgi:hypothetical protein